MNLRAIPFLVIFLVICSAFITGGDALAESGWAPTHEHYAASIQAKDCAIYRHVVREAQTKVAEFTRRKARHVEEIKGARADIGRCARAKGVQGNLGPEQETLIAELCPEAYAAWLAPGYRWRVAQEDIKSALKAYQDARVLVRANCAALPGQ